MEREHRNADHVFYRNPTKFYPTAVRGEGVYIHDADGKTYLDGSGGAAVVTIGHGVPEIREAMLKQADLLAFAHGSQFTSAAAVSLADRIVAICPTGLVRVYYLSGGSEAVETAVKLARQYQVDRGMPSKYKVISRWTSYHGNTLGALALGGHTGRRKYYLPLIQHTPHIVPAYCYRCPFGRIPDACSLECADDLEKTILYESPDSVSAFMAEPVVGATAGALVPPPGYFQRIREICNRYDVLLIVDEVMTGFRVALGGACGLYSLDPDLVTLGKIVGGGLPVGVFGGKREFMNQLAPLGPVYQAGTLSGNPLAMAAGLATVSYLQEHAGEVYPRLEATAKAVAEGVAAEAAQAGIPLTTNRVGSMWTWFFNKGPVTNYAQAARSDTAAFGRFHRAMLERGIWLPPSQFEAAFLSYAHTDAEVQATIAAARQAFNLTQRQKR